MRTGKGATHSYGRTARVEYNTRCRQGTAARTPQVEHVVSEQRLSATNDTLSRRDPRRYEAKELAMAETSYSTAADDPRPRLINDINDRRTEGTGNRATCNQATPSRQRSYGWIRAVTQRAGELRVRHRRHHDPEHDGEYSHHVSLDALACGRIVIGVGDHGYPRRRCYVVGQD